MSESVPLQPSPRQPHSKTYRSDGGQHRRVASRAAAARAGGEQLFHGGDGAPRHDAARDATLAGRSMAGAGDAVRTPHVRGRRRQRVRPWLAAAAPSRRRPHLHLRRQPRARQSRAVRDRATSVPRRTRPAKLGLRARPVLLSAHDPGHSSSRDDAYLSVDRRRPLQTCLVPVQTPHTCGYLCRGFLVNCPVHCRPLPILHNIHRFRASAGGTPWYWSVRRQPSREYAGLYERSIPVYLRVATFGNRISVRPRVPGAEGSRRTSGCHNVRGSLSGTKGVIVLRGKGRAVRSLRGRTRRLSREADSQIPRVHGYSLRHLHVSSDGSQARKTGSGGDLRQQRPLRHHLHPFCVVRIRAHLLHAHNIRFVGPYTNYEGPTQELLQDQQTKPHEAPQGVSCRPSGTSRNVGRNSGFFGTGFGRTFLMPAVRPTDLVNAIGGGVVIHTAFTSGCSTLDFSAE